MEWSGGPARPKDLITMFFAKDYVFLVGGPGARQIITINDVWQFKRMTNVLSKFFFKTLDLQQKKNFKQKVLNFPSQTYPNLQFFMLLLWKFLKPKKMFPV